VVGEELKKTSRSVVVELTKTLRSVVEELMNWSLIQLELLVVVVGHSTWEQPWEQQPLPLEQQPVERQPLEQQPVEQQPLEPQELLQTGTSTAVGHYWKMLLAYSSLRLVYSSGSSSP
jgi:D-mannonate dehydratase